MKLMILRNDRRGFTLVELTLAIVVGALVLLGVTGVFAAAHNMDRIFGDQYEHTTQLHITQMTIRRSLLSLQVEEDRRANAAIATNTQGIDTQAAGEVEDRPRVILEIDPAYAQLPGPWQPQRFEVVVSTPPIALNMATKAAAWARITDRDEDSLDFSSTDASGGVLRSVFELRPDGSRESIMRRVGLLDPDPQADRELRDASDIPNGWTLWWRPILRTESNFLRDGGMPLKDSAGTEDEIRFRLAGAIPLVKDIELCSWTIYKSDVKVTEYEALTMSSLPAYAEFELLLNSGQYATWMFEIDWVLGDDPLDIGEDDDTGANGGGASGNDDGNGNGGRNDDNSGPSNGPNDGPNDGGGVIVPGQDNQNGNMGGGPT